MLFGKKVNPLDAELAAAKEKLAEAKAQRDEARAKIKELRAELEPYHALGFSPAQLQYKADGLAVWGKNLSFLAEPRFQAAYDKGERSGHLFGGADGRLHVEWRVHVALWAAAMGLRLQGDFVECGVNTGIFSLAIAEYHQLARTNRHFYLFDTFCGTPEDQMSEQERAKRLVDNERYYPDCYEVAKANFAPYPNMQLVRGRVPDTLHQVTLGQVAYLSIDMNVAVAERAALEFFWSYLAPGAPILLDDYGWAGCEAQKEEVDAFSAQVGAPVVTLPTGQGLMFKL
jgi:O-methyltransferase